MRRQWDNNCNRGQISPINATCITLIELGDGATIPTGPQGPIGPTGAAGSQGATGNTGAQGPSGTSGFGGLWVPFLDPPYAWDGTTGTGGFNYVFRVIPAFTLNNAGDSIKITVAGIVPNQGGAPINGGTGGYISMSLIPHDIQARISAQSVNTQEYIAEILVQLKNPTTVTIGVIVKYYISGSLDTMVGVVNGGTIETESEYPAFDLAFNPAIDVNFQMSFNAATTTSGVGLIEGLVAMFGTGSSGTFAPIYTVGTGATTYQNNALIGINPNNFWVAVDKMPVGYGTEWTFVSSTGTITWVLGAVNVGTPIFIIPN
jgi:hypothetical protein